MATITNKREAFKLHTDFGDIEFPAGRVELDDEKWDHCSRYHDIKQRIEGSTLVVEPSKPNAAPAPQKAGGVKVELEAGHKASE